MVKLTEELNFTEFDEAQVGGVRTSIAGRQELTEAMVNDCKVARQQKGIDPRLVFDSNGQGVSMNATNLSYRDALAEADIVHADGQAIVWAAKKLAGKVIQDRSATTDMIHDCAKAAAQEGLSFYLLGGEPGVAENCAEILKSMYPKLKIVGHNDGYFADSDIEDIISGVNSAKPDVVWVGLGKPKEQIFCSQFGRKIDAGWVVTCGGCFNYITGDYPRAPKWMQDTGIEWLHRMATNPRKLFVRYLTTTPHALFLLLTRTKRT